MFAKNEICRLNQKLESLEVKFHISRRWTKFDTEYLIFQEQLCQSRMRSAKAELFKLVAKRQFLLNTKAKYAGTMYISYSC